MFLRGIARHAYADAQATGRQLPRTRRSQFGYPTGSGAQRNDESLHRTPPGSRKAQRRSPRLDGIDARNLWRYGLPRGRYQSRSSFRRHGSRRGGCFAPWDEREIPIAGRVCESPRNLYPQSLKQRPKTLLSGGGLAPSRKLCRLCICQGPFSLLCRRKLPKPIPEGPLASAIHGRMHQ